MLHSTISNSNDFCKRSNEFLKSIDPKNRKSLHKTWEVEHPETTWILDSENQFISEYVKDEIIEATFLCFDLGDSKFKISFSNHSYEKPNTHVSIALPNRDEIEKVFKVFETSYSEIIEKSKDVGKDDTSALQIATRYSFEKKLPSVFVDKRLLVDLERYILHRCRQLDVRRKQVPDYYVTIIDSSGTMSLQSIESYPREIFDNEIETVSLAYGGIFETIKIYLRFAKSRERSEIEISYKGENAREIVESIKIGIMQRLKDAKTWNAIYHIPWGLQGILIWVTLAGFVGIIINLYREQYWSQTLTATTIGLAVYLFAPIFKPYTAFETRRNMSIRKWSGWLVESLLGILLIWLLWLLFPAIIH